MKFHNGLVDHVRAQGLRADQVFGEARRLTRWHFQWVVVHDFLPRLVGQALVDQILEERSGKPAKVSLTVYKPTNPNRPMMPVEFSVAAYRFGHSMIRPRYTVNDTPHVGRIPFFGEQPTDRNLNGSRPLPSDLVVSWRFLYDIDPGTVPRPTRRIDSRLAFPLFSLPGSVVPPLPSGQPDPRVSLAERNLLRGKRLGLPSGQRVAQEMGVTPLSNGQLGLADEPGWKGEAPLWFYILKEAELQHNGEQLGAVGGRIVSEVLVGLLAHDPTSYLSRDPLFKPAPPIAPGPGQFAMADLLKFAGVA